MYNLKKIPIHVKLRNSGDTLLGVMSLDLESPKFSAIPAHDASN
jgi:hypothetical protein